MNPMKWKSEHRAALAIGAAIGGTLGALVSWVMAYPSTSRVTTPIKWWVEHYGDQLLVLLVVGALIGVGCVYVARLLRE